MNKELINWVRSGKDEDLKAACLKCGLEKDANTVQYWMDHEKKLIASKQKYSSLDYDLRNAEYEAIRGRVLNIANPPKPAQKN